MSRTVLVTGATLRRFLENLSGSVSYREVDVTDRAAVAVLVRDVRPARAVHGAAITSIPPEVERARFVETVEVNVTGTLNVLAAPGLGSRRVHRVAAPVCLMLCAVSLS